MKNITICYSILRRVFGVVKTTDSKAVSFQRCFSTEAGLKEKTSSSNVSPEEDPEWKTAKPLEEMPGYRNLPILGTAWVILPIVGNIFIIKKIIIVFESKYL